MARPIAKDHDQKRSDILMVAAQVFAHNGITKASMNDVAKQCGISKANIYHYYSSKDELIFGILDNYLSELRDRICYLKLDNLSTEEQLRSVVTACLLAYDGMDNEHKIQNEGLPLLSNTQQALLKDYQREMVAVVRSILLQGFSNTLSNNKTLLRSTTMSVFAMMNWFYMWHPKATRKERKAYANTIVSMTFHGIGGCSKS